MMRSRMCGSVVMPEPPEPPPANDQSCGRIRSSYGPSNRRTHVAASVCYPALIDTGLGRSRAPPPPAPGPAVRAERVLPCLERHGIGQEVRAAGAVGVTRQQAVLVVHERHTLA